jgi:hypothetical protein
MNHEEHEKLQKDIKISTSLLIVMMIIAGILIVFAVNFLHK